MRQQGAAIPPPVAFFPACAARLLRAALLLIPLAAPLPVQADAALDAARRLADAGAGRLALTRIERLAPPAADPRWPEWESLRLELLSRTGAHDALLARVAALPPSAPGALRQRAYALGASAALAGGDGDGARRLLARLLWDPSLAAVARREARLLVIDSYLKERRPQEAYLAMLRFRQDSSPVRPGEAERFAAGLLELGRINEALTWADRLDEESPTRLLLRLRAGLATPQAALETARARAAREPRYWEVVAQAAGLRADPALQIEARERLLDAAEGPADSAVKALWQLYDDYARQLGNERALLLGDDAAWTALAETAGPPAASRALWALLAREARAPLLREQAASRLLATLAADRLERTALALFGRGSPLPAAQLGADARHRLGAAAAKLGRATSALGWWRGLTAPPPGVDREAWLLSLAQVQAAAGLHAEAAATLRTAIARLPLSGDSLMPVLDVAGRLAEAGQADVAAQAASTVLRQAQGEARRAAGLLLGELAGRRGDWRAAAEYLLDAAFAQPGAPDRALQLRGADALARAGLREDARAVYGALLEGADEQEKQELRRRMARLE